MKSLLQNKDDRVVRGFGEEWERFTQATLEESDSRSMFEDFFAIFPWDKISTRSVGADFGCGSGRWARLVAPKVGHLHLIDASEQALAVARDNLATFPNVTFHHVSVDETPLVDDSLDFAYCLGVLHHIPDVGGALGSIVRKLKPSAPLLIYLYYAFDNRPWWFRRVWLISDMLRRVVSRAPRWLRFAIADVIAALIYWPIARTAKILERFGTMPASWPLSWYRERSLYVMRTDALDRFGTRLERRFTRPEMEAMLRDAGLTDIEFSLRPPFWCAVAFKTSGRAS